MSDTRNDLGQLIGPPVPDFTKRSHPPRTAMVGRFCRVEPLSIDAHAADLYAANETAPDARYWTYLPYGPFKSFEDYKDWMTKTCLGEDPLFHAIVDRATGKAVGVASYLRIDAANGVIEVGHIHFSPLMQGSPASTEAMYLMMARVFDELGYRRYEWKCNNLNEASKSAARRLGFNYEGTFRQMSVVKGHNRDTAWFAILDSEWPAVKAAFQQWLTPDNFDSDGQQKSRLSALTDAALR